MVGNLTFRNKLNTTKRYINVDSCCFLITPLHTTHFTVCTISTHNLQFWAGAPYSERRQTHSKQIVLISICSFHRSLLHWSTLMHIASRLACMLSTTETCFRQFAASLNSIRQKSVHNFIFFWMVCKEGTHGVNNILSLTAVSTDDFHSSHLADITSWFQWMLYIPCQQWHSVIGKRPDRNVVWQSMLRIHPQFYVADILLTSQLTLRYYIYSGLAAA
jgi:hypothetical protein